MAISSILKGNTSASSSLSATSLVFNDYKSLCSLPRNEPHLAITEALRAHHPNQHVTSVDTRQCDILEFAAAGHASVQLTSQDDSYLRRRTYEAPKSRLVDGLGSLGAKVSFGHFRLRYQDLQCEFYVAEWSNPFQGTVRNNYILSSKAIVDEDGHSPKIDAMLLVIGRWTSELHKELYVFDDGDWVKSSLLWDSVQSASWDDVILDPAMKQNLIQDVQSFFDSRSLFQEYAVPWKRGIIMHGRPGCGKTISIKALMKSLEQRTPPVASLYVKSFDCCAGVQYSVRQIFIRARSMAPCLLVFEDLDSLVVNKVRSYFLNEVDGLEDNNGILMLGSTNHLERLDPGISKRPSRFDRKYHYRLPNEQARVMYCDYWRKKLERNSNVNFPPELCGIVAKMTDGFSFAYMKELFVQTLLTIATGRDLRTDDDEVEEKPEGVSVKPENGDTGLDSIKKANAEMKQDEIMQIKVPDYLKDSSLLKTLRLQLIVLWNDMASTEEPEPDKNAGQQEEEDKEDEEDEEYQR